MIGASCFGIKKKTSRSEFNLNLKPKYIEKKNEIKQENSLIDYWKLFIYKINQIPSEFINTPDENDIRQFNHIENLILSLKLNSQDIESLNKPSLIFCTYGSIRNDKVQLINYKLKKEKILLKKDRSKSIKKSINDFDDSFTLKTFINEICLLKFCNHENIVKLRGVVLDLESSSFITEYEGKSLANFLFNGQIEKWWETSTAELIDIGIDVIKGLQYLHANDIIHRDLKSANIYLYWRDKQNLVAKISNFSLAYSSTHGFEYFNRSKMALNVHAGTPRWMAPEIQSISCDQNEYQTNIERYSTKSDIYAYGITLSEIFSAMLPFWSIDKNELKKLIILGKLYLTEFEVRNDVPYELIKLIWDCTNFAKFLRPESVHIFEKLESVKKQNLNNDTSLYKKRILVKRN